MSKKIFNNSSNTIWVMDFIKECYIVNYFIFDVKINKVDIAANIIENGKVELFGAYEVVVWYVLRNKIGMSKYYYKKKNVPLNKVVKVKKITNFDHMNNYDIKVNILNYPICRYSPRTAVSKKNCSTHSIYNNIQLLTKVRIDIALKEADSNSENKYIIDDHINKDLENKGESEEKRNKILDKEEKSKKYLNEPLDNKETGEAQIYKSINNSGNGDSAESFNNKEKYIKEKKEIVDTNYVIGTDKIEDRIFYKINLGNELPLVWRITNTSYKTNVISTELVGDKALICGEVNVGITYVTYKKTKEKIDLGSLKYIEVNIPFTKITDINILEGTILKTDTCKIIEANVVDAGYSLDINSAITSSVPMFRRINLALMLELKVVIVREVSMEIKIRE